MVSFSLSIERRRIRIAASLDGGGGVCKAQVERSDRGRFFVSASSHMLIGAKNIGLVTLFLSIVEF